MEEKKNILTQYLNSQISEDKVAEAFNIDLENSDNEKSFRTILDSTYALWFEMEEKEKGTGASVIDDCVTTLSGLSSKEEEKKQESQPKLQTSDNGTYHGIFLAPMNHLQRITDALNRMAENDEELAKAIAEGKKTFEGCDRFIRNNMKDLAREMGKQEITFDDDSIHAIARWYMVNPDAVDVQNVVKEVKKAKEKKKSEPKKTETPKKENKKETKVVPLTPQMGSLFSDEDFE